MLWHWHCRVLMRVEHTCSALGGVHRTGYSVSSTAVPSFLPCPSHSLSLLPRQGPRVLMGPRGSHRRGRPPGACLRTRELWGAGSGSWWRRNVSVIGWAGSLSGVTVEAKPRRIIQRGEMGLFVEATTLLASLASEVSFISQRMRGLFSYHLWALISVRWLKRSSSPCLLVTLRKWTLF